MSREFKLFSVALKQKWNSDLSLVLLRHDETAVRWSKISWTETFISLFCPFCNREAVKLQLLRWSCKEETRQAVNVHSDRVVSCLTLSHRPTGDFHGTINTRSLSADVPACIALFLLGLSRRCTRCTRFTRFTDKWKSWSRRQISVCRSVSSLCSCVSLKTVTQCFHLFPLWKLCCRFKF